MKRDDPLLRLTTLIGFAVLVSLGFLAFVRWGIRPPEYGGLKPGRVAPPIQAQGWLNGQAPTLESLVGKVVVVDAWASWCRPCRQKAPELVELYEKYRDRGVLFIGLTDEDAGSLSEIEAFLKDTGITWSNGYGAVETLKGFELAAVPSLWVIGRDGQGVWNIDSSKDPEHAIDRALAKAELH